MRTLRKLTSTTLAIRTTIVPMGAGGCWSTRNFTSNSALYSVGLVLYSVIHRGERAALSSNTE